MKLKNLFKSQITHLNIETTNQCNLKCFYCGIWKDKKIIEFPLNQIKTLLKEYPKLKSISITGGEPFLSKNLTQIIKIIQTITPKTHINISTNGTLSKQIESTLTNTITKNLSITISFDGVNSNNIIRGKNSTKKIQDSIKIIKKHIPHNKIFLKLTVNQENQNEIIETANYAKIQNIYFYLKFIENINCYHSRNNSKTKNVTISDNLKQSIQHLIKNKLVSNLKYCKNHIKKKPKCLINKNSLFLESNGNTYMCRYKDKIKNIITSNLPSEDEIKQKQKEIKICKDNCSPFYHK